MSVLCPDCGGMGEVLQNAYDDEDRYIRLRRCRTCGTRYPTVEVVVPGSFYEWADSHRYAQTVRMRRLRGYHDTASGRYRRKRPRLAVEVRVIPPKAAA